MADIDAMSHDELDELVQKNEEERARLLDEARQISDRRLALEEQERADAAASHSEAQTVEPEGSDHSGPVGGQ